MTSPDAVELHEDEAPKVHSATDKVMVSQTVELDDDGEARVVDQGPVYVEGRDGVVHVYPDVEHTLDRE